MIAEIARQNMVASQLRTNRVTDERLLEAFATVPRERFVPTGRRAVAYVDEDIEIARGRFLMEPRVLGRMLQSLAPAPGAIALVAWWPNPLTFLLAVLLIGSRQLGLAILMLAARNFKKMIV